MDQPVWKQLRQELKNIIVFLSCVNKKNMHSTFLVDCASVITPIALLFQLYDMYHPNKITRLPYLLYIIAYAIIIIYGYKKDSAIVITTNIISIILISILMISTYRIAHICWVFLSLF